jgi:hypothetical protein
MLADCSTANTRRMQIVAITLAALTREPSRPAEDTHAFLKQSQANAHEL